MIIDAKKLIIGRLASFAAKRALLGEKVDVVNCEYAVITGSRKVVLAKYKERLRRGTPEHGPFNVKREDRFMRRVIRGMLPYTQPKGRAAFDKVMCHIGVPKKFEGEELQTIKSADIIKTQSLKYVTVKEVCKFLGKKE